MIRQKVGQSLFAVSNKLRRIIDKEHQGLGISGGQARVLNFIYRNSLSGDVYQKDLETFFSVRSSSATEFLQKLEESGLITKEVSTEDRRKKKITLTDKGLEVVKQTLDTMDKLEQSYKQSVGKENHQEFIKLLDLFEQTLEEMESSYV